MPSLFLKVKREDRLLFERTFQVPFGDYFDGMFGFEIIKFDDKVIKPKKNQSMSDAILEKYGQEAVDLIKRLIQII